MAERTAASGMSEVNGAEAKGIEANGAETNGAEANSELKPRLEWYQDKLHLCSDAVFHKFSLKPDISCVLIYFSGMFDEITIQKEVLGPMLVEPPEEGEDLVASIFDQHFLPLSDAQPFTGLEKGLDAILNGFGILLVDGEARMLELPYTSMEKRSIEEAPNESVIRGPREAFIEDININVTLLRRRIRSQHFKMERLTFGEKTKTSVMLAYMEGICPDSLVQEIKRRLSYLKIDGVLGSSYLEENIIDKPYSPFPQMQYTERPDTVAGAVLEGRVALIVDNTPMTLIAPVNFFMLLQSAEDYYQPFIAATWIRWIRMLFLLISLLLPSLYIAITTFHPEMLPFNLLISVSSSREIVPFPALMEALMMEIAFEALREASVRIPKSIGQAVSIIGALIIGTAAVQAGIASAAMVIIVSLTGIASFIIPNFDLGLSFRLLRFFIMILAGVFGIFGISCGLILIFVHMVNLEPFGTPYLSPVAPVRTSNLKDTLFRAPWWGMRNRPVFLNGSGNTPREARNLRGWEGNNQERDANDESN